ncbi:MAG TPA: ABC transporter substrate-binding protein [Nocardioidaceae bacterium]|nr:ABC transporter substrate-binding protein [Nocardioidaceae bacterium]
MKSNDTHVDDQDRVRGEAQALGHALGGWSPSRRGLLGMMLAAPLVAACGAGGSNGGSSSVPNAGTLVFALDDQPASLDPAQVSPEDIGMNMVFNVYDRLLDIPAGSADLAPSLSTKIPSPDNGLISKDGLTYTFPLRTDVTFHDGSPLTADAVKYSWERALKMNLSEGQSERLAKVKAMRAVDDHTFEVTLSETDGSFLRSTAAAPVASVVNPAVVEAHGGVVAGKPNEWMAQNVASSGPYTFGEWVRGDHMTFEVYKDYWGTPAHLPVLLKLLVKEQATMLRAKEADIMSMAADRVPKVQGIDYVTVDTSTLGLQLDELGFNMKIDPSTLPNGDDIPADFFQDVRVRKAFNYSFPYDTYIKGVLGGFAERVGFVIPKGIFGYDPSAGMYDTDPAKAEQLFREAGWWDRGFTMSIVADGTNGAFNGAALAMKDGIEKLNPKFHVQVLSVPEAKSDKMMAQDPIPAAMWSYTSPPLTAPSEYAYDQAHPDGKWGQVGGFRNGYSDPDKVAAICEEASSSPDKQRRLDLYSQLQRIQYDEAMWVITAQESLPMAYGNWLKGVAVNPLWPRPSFRWALYSKPSAK